MIVGGIDPGAKGAMVFVDNGEIVAEHPFTTIGKEPDLDAIMDCFYSAKRLGGIHKIYLEKVHGRPLLSSKAVFGLGRHFGICEAFLVSFGFRYEMVPPATWTKKMHTGVTTDLKPKDKSRIAAKRLFPNNDLIVPGCRTPHSGLVDAALIAQYGYEKEKHGQ